MMGFNHGRGFLAAFAATAAVLMFAGAAQVIAADSAAVATLIGSWSGTGRVNYTDGSTETVQCNAYYTGGGSELRMTIQCQSPTNPINMRSRLKIDGAKASGEWEERTFNATGTASGKVGADNINMTLGGGGFTGSMAVSFSKAQHSVNISTQGIGMSKASIQLNRR